MKNPVHLAFMALIFGLVPFSGFTPLYAQTNTNERYNGLTAHVAGTAFIAGPIPRQLMTNILFAGSRAPSAHNDQPWHFTVVQNLALGKQIVPEFLDGNALIIVSAFGDGKTNGGEILDCGLAVENIYLAAQALGLGSRIYTGPVDTINRHLKDALSLPNGYSAVALVRVGNLNLHPDAVSAPSARKSMNSIVTYK
jgi:nitroreductase